MPDLPKIDPKRPESHPDYERSRRAGLHRWKKMQKELSPAEQADHIKRVKSNPNNVLGMPTFYPAEVIRSAMNNTGLPGIECPGCGFSAIILDEGKCPRCKTPIQVK